MCGVDPGRQKTALVGRSTHADHAGSGQGKHPRAQLSEPPQPENHDPVRRLDVGLLQDLQGRRKGLHKHRTVIRHSIRNDAQVLHGQAEPIGKGTISTHNPEYCALTTVVATPSQTGRTLTARAVDLPDHPLSDQGRIRGILHHTDPLMPEDPTKAHVAANQLQVSGTDPAQ